MKSNGSLLYTMKPPARSFVGAWDRRVATSVGSLPAGATGRPRIKNQQCKVCCLLISIEIGTHPTIVEEPAPASPPPVQVEEGPGDGRR